MLPVGNPASWMTKHDKDACFALNSCGQIAKKRVALRSCDENHFCLQSEIPWRFSVLFYSLEL